jgi:hypothetical protein
MNHTDSWVERRASCTLEGIIELLREIFATDVRKLNELNLRDITFRFYEHDQDKLHVLRERRIAGFEKPEVKGVVVQVDSDRSCVEVRREGRPISCGKPYVSENGRCLMLVDDDPRPYTLEEFTEKVLGPLAPQR